MSPEQARERAKRNWGVWRLLLSGVNIEYETAWQRMTHNEILEANAALDLYFEAAENRKAQAETQQKMKKLTRRR